MYINLIDLHIKSAIFSSIFNSIKNILFSIFARFKREKNRVDIFFLDYIFILV